MLKEFFIRTDSEGNANYRTLANNFSDLTPNSSFHVRIEKKNRRSNEQNRYMWGCVVPIVQQGFQHLGHDITKEETHEFLKAKFNYLELVNEDTGEYVQLPRSTKRLSKIEFCDYIAKIQRWSAEWLNIQIPDPGHQMEVTYE